MTPEQVPEYLQTHPVSICRYITRVERAGAKVGGRHLIRREAVEELLAEPKVREETR